METAMASAAAKAARASSVSVQQMPLSFLKEGESAHVVKVRGKGDLQHHLENLGFVEGAEVKVVSGVARRWPSAARRRLISSPLRQRHSRSAVAMGESGRSEATLRPFVRLRCSRQYKGMERSTRKRG